MKKLYRNPKIEITKFATNNVITLSGGTDGAKITADALTETIGGNVETANLSSFTKVEN